jgi:hypothetical protein
MQHLIFPAEYTAAQKAKAVATAMKKEKAAARTAAFYLVENLVIEDPLFDDG